ncbi:ATP synthase F1 subunit delta [Ferruginibacter albus]|uniref:ATP synthase F1 subunit delta n=1 Tax=Ferruginibacter albus TaxID=2875540 RepID=UPI001CC3B83B|nr:ATP synthase F1 subunit delta [Ferruginibacter albus]UAY52376.1 ATP synthase F1 subunit delta [Ferruginibacter albus]
MDNPRLASRYAKSLIDLSIEQNKLEAVFNDMKMLKSICGISPEFVSMLRSPIILADKKAKIIAAVTEEKTDALTSAFIHLLVTKNRESNLLEIASAFIDQYNEIKNIHLVKLTTAVAISDDVKQSIVQKVSTMPGIGTVELEATVNPNLIGGFILETNNNLVDASILRDLKDVKKQFLNNEYIHKIR